MLNGLFASASVENILLFLFVNERAYASQIKQSLNLPLTPLQNALIRLENSGIVKSHFEKNRRVFSLSAKHPLSQELEALLKKAYALLPAPEKKRLSYMNFPTNKEQSRKEKNQKQLIDFWKKLSLVDSLNFTTRSVKDTESETKRGEAKVQKSFLNEDQILFHEVGEWVDGAHSKSHFSNQFLWTLDLVNERVSLEHLRYGPKNPVFLFDLKLSKKNSLVSQDPHLCKDDTYLGALIWSTKGIELNMRVIGPHKNHFLNYQYHSQSH